jgi:hypothetical protein
MILDLSKNYWEMNIRERQHYKALTGKDAIKKPFSLRESPPSKSNSSEFDGYGHLKVRVLKKDIPRPIKQHKEKAPRKKYPQRVEELHELCGDTPVAKSLEDTCYGCKTHKKVMGHKYCSKECQLYEAQRIAHETMNAWRRRVNN